MTEINVQLDDHPAQAEHPVTGEPLTEDGKPVSLFPDERCIRLDGQLIGYVGSKAGGRPIMFIIPNVHKSIQDKVKGLVEKAFPNEFKGKMHNVPAIPEDKE